MVDIILVVVVVGVDVVVDSGGISPKANRRKRWAKSRGKEATGGLYCCCCGCCCGAEGDDADHDRKSMILSTASYSVT